MNKAILITLITACGTVQAASPTMKLSLGYEYSQGDYGLSKESRYYYYPFSFTWQQAGWKAKLSSAYLSTRGPENLQIVDDGGVRSSATTSLETADYAGFSDTTLSMTRELDWGAAQGVYLDATVAVRLPTAQSSLNIAKRSSDYRFQLDGYIPLGNWMPIMGIGYRWMGDGSDIETRDVWQSTLGVQYSFNHLAQVGLIYDFRQSSTQGEPIKELMAYWSYKLSNQWHATSYLLTGVSDNSLDSGGGIQISYQF